MAWGAARFKDTDAERASLGPEIRPSHPRDVCTPGDIDGKGGLVEQRQPGINLPDSSGEALRMLITRSNAEADSELEKALSVPNEIILDLMFGEAKLAEKLGPGVIKVASKILETTNFLQENAEIIKEAAEQLATLYESLANELNQVAADIGADEGPSADTEFLPNDDIDADFPEPGDESGDINDTLP